MIDSTTVVQLNSEFGKGNIKLKHQVVGIFVTVIWSISCVKAFFDELSFILTARELMVLRLIQAIASMVSNLVLIWFFFEIIRVPQYLAGKPAFKKFWPFLFDASTSLFASICLFFTAPIEARILETLAIRKIIATFLILGWAYLMYMLDDEGKSCCLYFKPFIYVREDLEPWVYSSAYANAQYPSYLPTSNFPVTRNTPNNASPPLYGYPNLNLNSEKMVPIL